ncbi:universal stress protein [Aminithiophilus ramosus]|uniref:Universal stress protein n=2 Tax=Synergistales TaxID=649776 RepID=A0A9Q7AQ30_9BACT|nr:universal stress protein [Aminithiophilus ramosus]QTX33397.1 universal stress protein [Aminithiophilus ramosus]QVL36856.1 universal stress protein [Synergistota bacterium]
MKFDKILACVDGSEASPLVIRQALDWAAREGSGSLEILHVVDSKVEYPVLAAEFDEAADPRGEVEAKVLGKVEEMVRANLEEEESLPWTVKIITGRPYEVIVRRARELGVDLILLGHRRLSGWERLLLGSVASKVVPYAPCNVLVVRPGLERVGKVLIALDGTEESRSVASFGLDQARLLGAEEVLFLHVVEEVTEATHTYWGSFTVGPEYYARARNVAEANMDRLLSDLSKEREGDLPLCRSRVEVGRSHATIIDKAEKEKADLVIVGDRGVGSALEGFLLGSVSAKVVRYSPASVLVYRLPTGGKS